jgi:hypothetical protein
MEEVIDRINPKNLPRELAIQFLLRHAQCRMALTSEAGDNRQRLAAALRRLDPDSKQQDAPGETAYADAAASNSVSAKPSTAEESCAARFSRAYAAARHLSTSGRNLRPVEKAAA